RPPRRAGRRSCRAQRMEERDHGAIRDRAALPAAGVGRRREGVLHPGRARLHLPGAGAVHRRRDPQQGRPGRGLPVARGGSRSPRELRVPPDRRRRSLGRARPALSPRLLPRAPPPLPPSRSPPGGSPRHRRPGGARWVVPAPAPPPATPRAPGPSPPPDQPTLSFKAGILSHRMELLMAGQTPAATLFSGPYYFAEQLG